MEHKPTLKSGLQILLSRASVTSPEDLLPPSQRKGKDGGGRGGDVPRYVRVNTLKVEVEDVITELIKNGFGFPSSSPSSPSSSTSLSISKDPHVPNLLLLPPSSDLHEEALLKGGKIILQDKASCFPAHVLSSCLREKFGKKEEGEEGKKSGKKKRKGDAFWEEIHAIDACAAPG